MAKYLRYSHVGLQFFISVALFTGVGIWLDRRLGTVVLFTLLGLVLGFGGGVYSLYREFFPAPRPGRKPGGGKDRPG
ncbi:MAG: AtpZ/AtpI family protein [Planctomycetes bacterium]|nr:AtpZ/AtpI family protein [Planctomycetota bacterium]